MMNVIYYVVLVFQWLIFVGGTLSSIIAIFLGYLDISLATLQASLLALVTLKLDALSVAR